MRINSQYIYLTVCRRWTKKQKYTRDQAERDQQTQRQRQIVALNSHNKRCWQAVGHHTRLNIVPIVHRNIQSAEYDDCGAGGLPGLIETERR